MENMQNPDNEIEESLLDYSIDSLSERSDLNPEQVEALVRRYYQNRDLSWSNLSIFEKLRLFNVMYLIALVGNLFTIFGSILNLLSNYFPLGTGEVFIGAGAFCAWVSITKYLANT